MARHDYAYPFRIDPVSGQAARAAYEPHVDQMIRQVLLTSPGERIDLPDFGCGLRQLLFAPNTMAAPDTSQVPLTPNADPLAATSQLIILRALNKWLGDQIQVQDVQVSLPDPAQLLVEIRYLLVETQRSRSLSLTVI